MPYENEESLPEYDKLRLVEQKRVTDTITLTSNEDIYALFKMTPYYYKTGINDQNKIFETRLHGRKNGHFDLADKTRKP